MCKKKPGPRCYNHARPRFEKSQAHVEESEAAYQQALAQAGGDKSQVDPSLDEGRKNAYAARYEAMRQYYSTPKARKELKDTVIPQAEKNLAAAESAYETDPSEQNKRARTVARSESTKYRNLLVHGERRWSQSNADLMTHEKRNAALDNGDYDGARYDNVDLSRASSWDTLNSKPTWSQDRKSVRREMLMETPNQERISAVSDVQIATHDGGSVKSYRVNTTTHARFGYSKTADSSGAALPAWQSGKKVRKDKEFEYTKVRTHRTTSPDFSSYAEAKEYATKMSSDNRVPALLARQARDRTVHAEAKHNGINSREAYTQHMADLRQRQEDARQRELAANRPAPAKA